MERRAALEAISDSALQAEQDIAALVELVNPQQPRPLTRTLLDDLVRRSVSTGIWVSLVVDGDLDRLSAELAVAAHRAVQEGLTNAFRHAPGGDVAIDVRCRSSFAMTIVNEPAIGPAPLSASGSGHGLEGIRERMAALGGTATWGHLADGRWSVAIAAPIRPPSAAAAHPLRLPDSRCCEFPGPPGSETDDNARPEAGRVRKTRRRDLGGGAVPQEAGRGARSRDGLRRRGAG